MNQYTQMVLYTDADGWARFREEAVPLDEGTPAARLSSLMKASALQWRESPVGFTSDFHCTGTPQWLVVLQGFGPGQLFFSADTVPEGQVFDPARHGHRSRQVGDEPLVTMFVRA